MFTVKADPAVPGKLAGLLRPEACIRLKEYTRGGDRHVTKILGPGIDVRDGSRDLPCVVGGPLHRRGRELPQIRGQFCPVARERAFARRVLLRKGPDGRA